MVSFGHVSLPAVPAMRKRAGPLEDRVPRRENGAWVEPALCIAKAGELWPEMSAPTVAGYGERDDRVERSAGHPDAPIYGAIGGHEPQGLEAAHGEGAAVRRCPGAATERRAPVEVRKGRGGHGNGLRASAGAALGLIPSAAATPAPRGTGGALLWGRRSSGRAGPPAAARCGPRRPRRRGGRRRPRSGRRRGGRSRSGSRGRRCGSMPISFLVTWPRRQMSGISQRGSALRARPTFMRNQTAVAGARRARHGPARAGRCGSGAGVEQLLGLGQAGAVTCGSARRRSPRGCGRRAASWRRRRPRPTAPRRARARAAGAPGPWRGSRRPSGGADQTALHVGGGEQLLGAAAAGVGHDQDAHALAAGAAGAAAAVQQHLAVVGQVGVDDEAEVGQVEAARGDVGRDADPGAAVAQRLQRVGALALGQLARQRHGGEAALDQVGVQVADRLAGRAEHERAAAPRRSAAR